MDITANDLLGMGMVFGPLIGYAILVTSSGPWVKWVVPIMFILPISCYFIGASGHPLATFNGILLGVFLYVFSISLIAFVNVLRKPKKELGK